MVTRAERVAVLARARILVDAGAVEQEHAQGRREASPLLRDDQPAGAAPGRAGSSTQCSPARPPTTPGPGMSRSPSKGAGPISPIDCAQADAHQRPCADDLTGPHVAGAGR